MHLLPFVKRMTIYIYQGLGRLFSTAGCRSLRPLPLEVEYEPSSLLLRNSIKQWTFVNPWIAVGFDWNEV